MAQRRFDSGLEMTNYQGLEAQNTYQGMLMNDYPGNNSEDAGSGKPAFHMNGNVYTEDPRALLHRDLKTRQISMIALGGALGTGLLVNTGPYLAQSGPGSMIIGYALVGVLCYSVMAAMGEMAAWLPIPSGFTGFAHRFVDPALGFALGWNYWFKYIITTPNNLIASTLVIKYWFDVRGYTGPASHPALYVALLLVAIIAINYFGVGVFGEFEFWLSSVKVLVILGLIIFTVVVAAGGGGKTHPKGFHYWNDPGAFAVYPGLKKGSGQFLGFWSVLSSAVFSFLGAELVGVTVGEAQNPRKAIPRAVRLTFFRIVFFYLVLVLLLGMTVPYNSPLLLSAVHESDNSVNAEASPFVVAARIAGVNTLPNLINVCLLVFTFSAANSDLYIATRTLYSLAVEGNAPSIFSHTDQRGVPIYSLALSSAFCCIAFISEKIGAFKAFQYFVSLVTIFGILTWISILISHIYFVRARMAQNIPDSALTFVSPFGANGSLTFLVFACVILVFNGWADFIHTDTVKFDWKNFIVDYIGVPLYLLMIFGYKIIMKTEGVRPEDADLFSGKQKIDEDEAEFLAEELRRKGGVSETRYERLYRVTLGNFF
ncbi:Dicarboxylic amino acid permease [Hyphodiscus hymeniophilus]|uniref:Dicarboxylic amino acid permease n=1 Tax=Hyphodiscus hymeniophilus TaxID=353542 RepID=A0A9P6VH59_9HELO|nr:Dicarboxylic amino acid permease [Hyphodiscus hymeniophilus]